VLYVVVVRGRNTPLHLLEEEERRRKMPVDLLLPNFLTNIWLVKD
jgi:hypothetical protein